MQHSTSQGGIGMGHLSRFWRPLISFSVCKNIEILTRSIYKKYRVRERAECTKMIKVRTRPNPDFVKNMWELQRARTPNVAKHSPKPSTKWIPNRNNIHPNGTSEESKQPMCNIQHPKGGGWEDPNGSPKNRGCRYTCFVLKLNCMKQYQKF